MFGSLVNALKGLQGQGGDEEEGGIGQGLLKGLQDFSQGFGNAQQQQGQDPWSQAIGGITSGIQSGMATRAAEKGMPPRMKQGDVPLAGPPGGGVPPIAPGDAIPGAPPPGPAPSPDQIGAPPRFKDQYANRPLMF
jgi:hypothetical protein